MFITKINADVQSVYSRFIAVNDYFPDVVISIALRMFPVDLVK